MVGLTIRTELPQQIVTYGIQMAEWYYIDAEIEGEA